MTEQGWNSITYVFITLPVYIWRTFIETTDLYPDNTMNIFSFLVDLGGSIFDEIYGGSIGFNLSLLYEEFDSWSSQELQSVIIDPFSRYISNMTWGKNDYAEVSILYMAYTWYHKKGLFSDKWYTRYVNLAFPWSSECYYFQ